MKTIAVENGTYNKLSRLKSTLSAMMEKSLTFSELLEEVMRRPLGILLFDSSLIDSLKTVLNYLSQNDSVLGVILFGSVAKGTYNANSDIDLFIIMKDVDTKSFDYVERSLRKTEIEYIDRLISSKLPTRFSPFICDLGELDFVRPIFFDIADNGMILLDRYSTATGFVDKYLSLSHSREYTESGEVLTW